MKNETVESLTKKIGNRIKNIRLTKRMTQLDLAIQSDMDENAVQRLERARTFPTLKTLLKIANGLDVDFRELFNFNENENNNL